MRETLTHAVTPSESVFSLHTSSPPSRSLLSPPPKSSAKDVSLPSLTRKQEGEEEEGQEDARRRKGKKDQEESEKEEKEERRGMQEDKRRREEAEEIRRRFSQRDLRQRPGDEGSLGDREKEEEEERGNFDQERAREDSSSSTPSSLYSPTVGGSYDSRVKQSLPFFSFPDQELLSLINSNSFFSHTPPSSLISSFFSSLPSSSSSFSSSSPPPYSSFTPHSSFPFLFSSSSLPTGSLSSSSSLSRPPSTRPPPPSYSPPPPSPISSPPSSSFSSSPSSSSSPPSSPLPPVSSPPLPSSASLPSSSLPSSSLPSSSSSLPSSSSSSLPSSLSSSPSPSPYTITALSVSSPPSSEPLSFSSSSSSSSPSSSSTSSCHSSCLTCGSPLNPRTIASTRSATCLSCRNQISSISDAIAFYSFSSFSSSSLPFDLSLSPSSSFQPFISSFSHLSTSLADLLSQNSTSSTSTLSPSLPAASDAFLSPTSSSSLSSSPSPPVLLPSSLPEPLLLLLPHLFIPLQDGGDTNTEGLCIPVARGRPGPLSSFSPLSSTSCTSHDSTAQQVTCPLSSSSSPLSSPLLSEDTASLSSTHPPLPSSPTKSSTLPPAHEAPSPTISPPSSPPSSLISSVTSPLHYEVREKETDGDPAALLSDPPSSPMPQETRHGDRASERDEQHREEGENKKKRDQMEEKKKEVLLRVIEDHCHPTCETCRADCCRDKKDNCLSCDSQQFYFRPLYSDGTGRCIPLKPFSFFDDLQPSLSSSSSPTEGDVNLWGLLSSPRNTTASASSSESGHGVYKPPQDTMPDWLVQLSHWVGVPADLNLLPSFFSPIASSPGEERKDRDQEATEERKEKEEKEEERKKRDQEKKQKTKFSSSSSTTTSTSTKAISSPHGQHQKPEEDKTDLSDPSSLSSSSSSSSFLSSPFALPPPRHSSVCSSLPSRRDLLPALQFLHLFYIHADNNLEESALLDMEELLHPYIGRRALNAIIASKSFGVSGAIAGGAATGEGRPSMVSMNSQEREGEREREGESETRVVDRGSMPYIALGQMYMVVLVDRPKNESVYKKKIYNSLGKVHICGGLDYTPRGVITLQNGYELTIRDGTEAFVDLRPDTAYELLRIQTSPGKYEWLLLKDLGEVDMNSPLVLSSFIKRNLDLFPSQHLALTLWNHGSAWIGFGDDESNANGQPMSLKDITQGLRQGLRESERGKKDTLLKFSVLGFDACLMASFDVLEAVSPYAHFVIASEDNEPGHGWNYHLTDPTSLLSLSETITPSSSSSSVSYPFRLSTAYEYASRFIASYALHPRTSVALTLSLIQMKSFVTFKNKFEEVMDHLFACGGSSIAALIKRAISSSFTIKGCDMISLCSCFDLLDFLDNLLHFLSSSSSSSSSSLHHKPPEGSREISTAKKPRSATQQEEEEEERKRRMSRGGERGRGLEFLHFFLAEKVIGLKRLLMNNVVVMDVGGRDKQAGKYSGISLYFPNPNTQLNCKNSRGSSLWASQFQRAISTRYSSFVKAVQENRKGSIC
ncbi:calcium binding egf domain-containing protein, partial [Cystoisospora suis]